MIRAFDILSIMRWSAGGAILLLGVLFPGVLEQIALPLALILIACIGIPHGAVDQLLFLHLSRLSGKERGVGIFYIAYIGLILLYVGVWLLVPWFGFILFLVLSMYHFGQADWVRAIAGGKAAWVYYLCWGSFVLLTPILWHYESSKPIIETIVRTELPVFSSSVYKGACVGILGINAGMIGFSALVGRLTSTLIKQGTAQLFFLFGLYLTTPLLLGFALYFAGWHALTSMQDQISFLKKLQRTYSWKQYVRDAATFSVFALIGLGGVVWLFRTGGQVEAALGHLFMGIAAITLPHVILMDQLYRKNEI